jgi:hypothetical protein
VRRKKRRKPYLRYLWLDLNKTKTRINYFKDTVYVGVCFIKYDIQGVFLKYAEILPTGLWENVED